MSMHIRATDFLGTVELDGEICACFRTEKPGRTKSSTTHYTQSELKKLVDPMRNAMEVNELLALPPEHNYILPPKPASAEMALMVVLTGVVTIKDELGASGHNEDGDEPLAMAIMEAVRY